MACCNRCCNQCLCNSIVCEKPLSTQGDIVKMNTDTEILDKNGNRIEVVVPEPEYDSEIFGGR